MRTRLTWVLRTTAVRVVLRAVLAAVVALPVYLIGQSQEPGGQRGVFTVGSCALVTGDNYRCDGSFHPDQGSLPLRTVPVLDATTFYAGGTGLPAYLQAHGQVQLPTSDDGQNRLWWRLAYGALVALVLGGYSWIKRLRRHRAEVSQLVF